jgi:hypothetical protein
MYQAFSNLNTRFEHLLACSSLPLKLLSFSCELHDFKHRFTQIVTSNTSRIVSLRLLSSFSVKLFLHMFSIDLLFTRLECLFLDEIHTDNLLPLLNHLTLLPRLHYLSINVSYYVQDLNSDMDIYRLIFRLPVLNYCNVSFKHHGELVELPIAASKQEHNNTLKHLTISSECETYFDELYALLSYTPRLTHLSCHYLSEFCTIPTEVPVLIPNLTNVSLTLHHVPFDQFELFISHMCAQLKRLHISTEGDKSYLNADQWQRLILCHMSHLLTFDFQFEDCICNLDEEQGTYHSLIDRFTSQFWMEHRWYFSYEFSKICNASHIKFYSTHS